MSAGAGSAEHDAVEPGRVPPTRPANFGPPDALRTIVTRPRATVRWLLDHGDGGLWVYLLVGTLAFLTATITAAMESSVGLDHLFLRAPGLVFRVVPVCALLLLILLGGMMLAGRILGGAARGKDSILAIAWGLIPLVAVLPFAIARALFESSLPGPLASALDCVAFAASLAAAGLTVSTFAEGERFSWRRSVVALMLGVTIACAVHLVTRLPFAYFQYLISGRVG